MNDKLNSDKAIMRAMLFSEVIETVSKTFKSAFSTSTTNWLGMMSSSATKISEAFGTISSAFSKEAGTMVVQVSLAIKDEFESSSTSSTFQSGNLISKVVTEMESILSSSSISTLSPSFNIGKLIVEVSEAITGEIMKSTTSADPGRVIVATMKSLNTDITKNEAGSSSTKVDQAGLFKKVSTVIKGKFSDSSSIAPSTLMLEVTKTVNDELGSTVSRKVETMKLYSNALKAIFSLFKDLSSLTEKEEKEAKTIIRLINAFSNTISNNVDAGEIAVATVSSLVTFNEASSTKTPEIQVGALVH